MHKVTYTYTHPDDVVETIKFTQEDMDFREEFLTWAHAHGLITTETRVLDKQTIVHDALWESAEAAQAAAQHGGTQYAAFVNRVKNRLESSGGTYSVATAEV